MLFVVVYIVFDVDSGCWLLLAGCLLCVLLIVGRCRCLLFVVAC